MPAAAVRAATAALAALMLAGCAAQPAERGESESSVGVDVRASPAPSASPEPTASPEPSDAASGTIFEAQDGAMRVVLPEGWSVDDRSRMGEASQMYDTGPGWLNELVVTDADGVPMLWHRESYGNDFVDCDPMPYDLEHEVDPLAPEVRAETDADRAAEGLDPLRFAVIGSVQEEVEWDGSQAQSTGRWSASLDLAVRLFADGEDCGWATNVVATGRNVQVGAIADDGSATIAFASEQAARDWYESSEVATLLEVLGSLELTDAPLLEAAP